MGKIRNMMLWLRQPEVQNTSESCTSEVKTLKCNLMGNAGMNWSSGSGQDLVAGHCEHRT
jgi:hypothetical protein